METALGLVRHPGNESLFRAIEMSLLATLAGQPLHIHAEGLRGTGKTTIMRAVRRILPRIRRIKGCLFNCDPAHPHCPAHKGLDASQVASLGEEWVPMPFLEISHSAKIGTVVGSIDLGRLVSPTEPQAALLPGTIPQAHRGIIFVDEINRLAETSPELADVLLDVMGTKPGRVQIEETGLPAVELTVQVSVWAASNPDEDPGPLEEIRRQLSDRFDFALYTDRPKGADVVAQILSLAEAGGRPVEETEAELLRTRLGLRAAELHRLKLSPTVRQRIADLYSRFDLESLRAVQAIQTGVRLAACLAERAEASPEDLRCVVPMALRHRVDPETLRKVLAALSAPPQPEEAAPAPKSRFPGLSFGGMVAEAARPQQAQDRLDRPGAFPPDGDPGSPARSGAGRAAPGQGAAGQGARGQGASGAFGQGLFGQGASGQGLFGQGAFGRGGSGQGVAGQGASGDGTSGQGTSGQGAGAYDRAGAGGGATGRGAAGRGALGRGAFGRGAFGWGAFGRGAFGRDAGRPGHSGASGPGAGSGTARGRGPAGPRSWLRRAMELLGLVGEAPMQLPNPAEQPAVAPPHRARPLNALPPDEWVRSEEELGKR